MYSWIMVANRFVSKAWLVQVNTLLQVAVMMSGWLPDAQRDLSAMAIYQMLGSICFLFPYGLAIGNSTRWASLSSLFCRGECHLFFTKYSSSFLIDAIFLLDALELPRLLRKPCA